MSTTRIVLVEDDKWLRESFLRTLERENYDVTCADKSETAMDLIDEITPDLIVLDFYVRGGEVVGLLHELKSHTDLAKIPIVMITGHADRLDEATMRSYSVTELIDKATMHPSDLLASVKRVLS